MRHVLRGTAPSFAFGALGLLCAGCAGDSSTGDDLAAPPAAAHGPEARGVLPGVTLPRSATRAPRTGAVAGSLRTVWSAARDHRRGATPSFGTGLPFERGGAFEMEGETAPGGATFDGAIVWDPESSEMPVAVGGGRFDVTIDGVAYARSDLQSFAAVMPEEETGAPFVLLAGLTIESGPARGDIGYVVYALLPAEDLIPGTDVPLDGESRMVIFASGPIESEEPEIAGAATTGHISITSGGLATGDAITASVTGDFGAIAWDAAVGEPPPDGPPPEATGFTPGEYDVAFVGPGGVQCDGEYAGREAELAAVAAADLGFDDGAIVIGSSTPGAYEVSGAAVAGAFGVAPLALDYSPIDSSLALWVGFVESPAPGPSSLPRIGTYIALADPGSSGVGATLEGQVGAFYGDERSGCSVAFGASLSPR